MREFHLPALVEVPDPATLTDTVLSLASDAPHTVLMRKPGRDEAEAGWADVTAGEFGGDVRAVAKGLIAADVEAGDRVGLMARTRYEWTLVDYAIWACGAVTVPVYETSSAEQVEIQR